MMTLEEFMKVPYRMEFTPDNDEGGFVVSFPELPGCISVGDTIDEAYANAMDAKKAWYAAAVESGFSFNPPSRIEDYSGQFKLRIPKSLHKALAEHSKEEGISMNQYCLYLLSMNDAIHSGNKE